MRNWAKDTDSPLKGDASSNEEMVALICNKRNVNIKTITVLPNR